MRRTLAAVWSALWLVGCTTQVDLDRLKFKCAADSECGSGFVCRGERCVAGGSAAKGCGTGASELCTNGSDDDCDGLTDCADPLCSGLGCAANGRRCADGACTCSGNGAAPEAAEASCGDAIDNDCDGFADCLDPGCDLRACAGSGASCAASACKCSGNGGVPQTAESNCLDGKDNDCDGLIDCADPSCAAISCGVNGRVCGGGPAVAGAMGGLRS